MIDRIRVGGWVVVAALAAGACGEEPQLATEHIRTTLGGTPPAAMDAPEAQPVATERAGDAAAEAEDSLSADPAMNGKADVASPPVLKLENGDTVQLSDAVVAFYRDRGYESAWTGYDELTPEGRALLAAIGSVEYDGLSPERYRFDEGRRVARLLSADEAGDRKLEYLGDLDLLLTESFLRLTRDLEQGLVEPTAGGLAWRIERPVPDDDAVVRRLAAGEKPGAVLASIRPATPYYHRLAESHRRLRAVEATGGWSTVPEGETLSEGDRDARVAAVRARLMAGDDPQEKRLAGTGRSDPQHFDEDLMRAVERFQLRHTLHEDGAVGPNTVEAMNVPLAERIESVRLNLDRWRWMPRELGHMFLLVNVAGFELELVSGDTAIESMNVVVGRTANRTPLFQDTLQYVVVNPYWNVPVSIARDEIIPAAMRDPGYLARNNYEVLYNGNVTGMTRVSTSDVESGRYRIRQRPGPTNALGKVKFLFPNDMNIYLHDTPATNLFSQQARAFSHGCIRVERPADLARTLLEHLSDRDGSYYDELRARDGEQWVKLDRQIPIYILYFTAWTTADGTLRFHPDIYDRDRALEGERAEKLVPAAPRPIAADRTEA